MNIVIVEDSRLARMEITETLKNHAIYKIIGEAASVSEGLELINREKPDVLLLDIQLPDGDGFSLLEKLEHLPLVIFTTAYDQHAVSAFEVNALDYLLKPIEKDRLLSSLDKANGNLLNTRKTEIIEKKSLKDKIFIRDGEKYYFVNLADVFLFEVDGNYTRVYFDTNRPLLARSLSYLEERLDPDTFFRANRQHIVNLDFIDNVEPWVTEGLLVTLRNKQQIEVSRRQTKTLLSLLEL